MVFGGYTEGFGSVSLQGQDLQKAYVSFNISRTLCEALTCLYAAPIRSPSTRRARTPSSPRESAVTTESNQVMVVRRSPSSTRRSARSEYRPHNMALTVLKSVGQDHQEGRPAPGVHCLQIQDADLFEALQAVRVFPFFPARCFSQMLSSFELGGEKKTKGAALTFVSTLSSFSSVLLLISKPSNRPSVDLSSLIMYGSAPRIKLCNILLLARSVSRDVLLLELWRVKFRSFARD